MVGNGSPSSPNGACSVTAGKPCTQRAATRRNGFARRPNCQGQDQRARRPRDHGICAFFALSTPLTMKRRSPGRTSPRVRLVLDEGIGAGELEPPLEPLAFAVEDGDAGLADGDLVARVQIARGADVAERDDQHDRQAEPPQGESGQGWAPPPNHGRAPFDRLQRPLLYRAGRTDSPASWTARLSPGEARLRRPPDAAGRVSPFARGRSPDVEILVSRPLAGSFATIRSNQRSEP